MAGSTLWVVDAGAQRIVVEASLLPSCGGEDEYGMADMKTFAYSPAPRNDSLDVKMGVCNSAT